MQQLGKVPIFRTSYKNLFLSHLIMLAMTHFSYCFFIIKTPKVIEIFKTESMFASYCLIYFLTTAALNIFSILIFFRPIHFVLSASSIKTGKSSNRFKMYLLSLIYSLAPFLDIFFMRDKKYFINSLNHTQSYTKFKSRIILQVQIIFLASLLFSSFFFLANSTQLNSITNTDHLEANKNISIFSYIDQDDEIKIYGGKFESQTFFYIHSAKNNKSMTVNQSQISKELAFQNISNNPLLLLLKKIGRLDVISLLKFNNSLAEFDYNTDPLIIEKYNPRFFKTIVKNTAYIIKDEADKYLIYEFSNYLDFKKFNFQIQENNLSALPTEFENTIDNKRKSEVFNIDFLFSLNNLKLNLSTQAEIENFNKLIDNYTNIIKAEYDTESNTITNKLQRLKFDISSN